VLSALVQLDLGLLTVTRPTRSLVRALLCGGAGLLSLACLALPRGTAINAEGYLVLGPRGAREFGLGEGDTLVELSTARVRKSIRVAADESASRLGYRASCSRFFSRGDPTVVLMVMECTHAFAAEDGEALAAFNSSGSQVGRVIGFATPDDYREVSPARRRRP
jgi:hypothetical protein